MTPADVREQLQRTLGDAYRIERELTPGGMSRLFLATERSLDRQVVIKLLPPEYASEVSAARFQREITVTAHLQHPHVLPILSAGSKDGLLYYVMPYVDGESLRQRLQREGRLPVATAVQILREVADALARAHKAGIIHRDIKPENILLQDDHALLADFGVARALYQTTGSDRLTETGTGLGTPGYMAPEQLAGERHVDTRADVYALAVVGYEMLAGAPPFAGATPQAVAAAHFTSAPKPVSQLRADVPPAVSNAITRALGKEPGDRFPSAADFRDALAGTPHRSERPLSIRARWLAGVAAVAVVAAAGMLAWVRYHGAPPRDSAGPVRIAVLPFENLGDSADNYFADGMTDEVRGKLAALPGLEVISSASSNQYRRTTKPQEEIGRELRVRYLVVGRVRWDRPSSGTSRVRVEPELVQVADVASPTNRWQAPFDAPLTDVFQVQSDIARQVASALLVTMTPSAQRTLTARPTQSLDAYVAFLRGEEASKMGDDPGSLRRSVEAYRQAIALDSTFALAWARMSRRYALLQNFEPSLFGYDSARIGAERAIKLAPDLPDALGSMSFYYAFVKEDYLRALALDSTALKRAPNDATLLLQTASAELFAGRPGAALGRLKRATSLEPRFADAFYWLGVGYMWAHRCAEARAPFDRALALQPANLQFLQGRTIASLCEGDLAGAREVLHSVPAAVDPAVLVAYYAANSGLDDEGWVLDSGQEAQLLSLGPTAFDNNRATWAMVRAQQYAFRGDEARSRAYADSALPALEAEVRRAPDNTVAASGLHMLLGLALAYLGQKDRAKHEGERGLALQPVAKDHIFGPINQELLAAIYLRVGEQERALDLLESLLRTPSPFTPDGLRIVPAFTPLRGNPRFEKLMATPMPAPP